MLHPVAADVRRRTSFIPFGDFTKEVIGPMVHLAMAARTLCANAKLLFQLL